MNIRLIVALTAALAFSSFTVATSAQAQEKTEATSEKKVTAKEKDIRKFLKITGAAKLAEQSMRQMVQLYKRQMPQVPAKFWDDFLKEARGEDLMDLLVPVYDKHLTHDDIKALIKFHESPAGKRYTAALPQITAESQSAGEQWGMALGQKVLKKLEAEGYQ